MNNPITINLNQLTYTDLLRLYHAFLKITTSTPMPPVSILESAYILIQYYCNEYNCTDVDFADQYSEYVKTLRSKNES